MVSAADFGVKPEGFVRPTVQDLIALCEQDQKATIDPNFDVSPDSPAGQLTGIYMNFEALAWEALEETYNSFDADKAEDASLTNLAALTGTPRRSASRSTVTCTCTLTAGTTLLADVNFAAVDGDPSSRWTPSADFTAPSTGTHDLVFQAERAGPTTAGANTILIIATPVTGWTDVFNTNDATPGINADDNPTLRTRRQEELTQGGSGTVESLAAEIEASIPSVISVLPLNNTTMFTDADGLPPKSYELVIWDGVSPPSGNADKIAQIIWDKGTAGIQSGGNTSGTAIDRKGNNQTVRFSRTTQKNVYVTYAIAARPGYVGDAAFKVAVALAANEGLPGDLREVFGGFGPDDDVDQYDLTLITANLGAKILSVVMGLAPTPVSNADILISKREIARFDSSRILVV